MYAGINVLLAVSLNLVNGISGQFSLGHAGFMSIGAYVSAYLSMNVFSGIEIPFFQMLLSLVSGGIVAGFFGYLIGLPTLRLKGDYLAIVTLGFGEIIRVVILNINAVGGARGLPGIPKLSSFSWVFGLSFITVFFIFRLMKSYHGRALLAVREDEIAAESMGVNTTSQKVRAFAMSSFFAGTAGSLFAHYLTFLNPQSFDFNKSFEIVTMVVLGGLGSTSGAVIAGLSLTILREALRPLQEITHVDLRMVIYSLLLILMMLTRPNGLLGTKEIWNLKFRKKINERA